MFAVIQNGGKQYKVTPGTVLSIERIPGNEGDKIELAEVLLVNNEGDVRVGQPLVAGARVSAEIVAQDRGPKLIIFKKMRRRGKQLKKGHRQELTRVRITDIAL